MSQLESKTLFESLEHIEDPRSDRTKRHQLVDILVIAVCATICGADGWQQIAAFGVAKHEWLKEFLELPNEIPSPDTFARVFQMIKPKVFQEVFMEWVSAAVQKSGGDLVNIDGTQLRGTRKKKSYENDGKEGLRIVSAWAARNRIVLGQVKTDEKSNEITAIPKLLELLELTGCIVTIDAMGCQTAVVKQIVEQEGDYVISLKGNQGNLHKDIEDYFCWATQTKFNAIEYDTSRTIEKGHGRIEERRLYVTEDIEWLGQKEEWAGLRSIIMVEAQREVIGREPTIERRYFISSLEANAKQAMKAVRGHWKIENQLHWCLDVGFREDACRIRTGHAPENLAVLRHIALNLLKQERSCKLGINAKRLKAGWDNRYLSKVLNI